MKMDLGGNEIDWVIMAGIGGSAGGRRDDRVAESSVGGGVDDAGGFSG